MRARVEFTVRVAEEERPVLKLVVEAVAGSAVVEYDPEVGRPLPLVVLPYGPAELVEVLFKPTGETEVALAELMVVGVLDGDPPVADQPVVSQMRDVVVLG